MVETLQDFMSQGVFAFLLVFVRFGTALMIMPGIGDSFVSERIKLLFSLALTFSVFPVLIDEIPVRIPGTFALFNLIVMEFIIGLLIGTIARIFMMALDIGGMIISIQSGLGSAQLLNPALASQGSILGAFFIVAGVVIIFATNLHHLLIMGIFESYVLFPVGGIPETGSMAELIARAVSASFLAGVKISTPFIVLTLLIYTGMGVLSRLMPQVQVFMIALPLQILVSIILLSIILPAIFLFWLTEFEQSMIYFLSNGEQ